MTENVIITIGRQYGSGGREIGIRLAKKLEIPLYDHNLVAMAAKELGISEKEAKEADETALEGFLSSYIVGPGDYTAYMNAEDYMRPLSDRVYRTQSEIIKRLADRSPCVIVGRCAEIKKVDRERRYYYESNTGEEWGKSGTYQVVLNVSRTGIDKAVDMLAALFNGLCD